MMSHRNFGERIGPFNRNCVAISMIRAKPRIKRNWAYSTVLGLAFACWVPILLLLAVAWGW